MEKKVISDKTWNKIKCADGTYKTDIHSILKQQTITFYQSRFKSNGFDNTDADYLLQHVDTKLNEREKKMR